MWIAKDKNKRIYLFNDKPIKEVSEWSGDCASNLKDLSEEDIKDLESTLNFMSWDDPEPVELGLHIRYGEEDVNKSAREYLSSIKDPGCPFYTEEDIINAFIKGRTYVDSKG